MKSLNIILFGGLILPYALGQQTNLEILENKGNLAFTQGNFADAERSYFEALKQSEKTTAATPHLPILLSALASIYNLEGRYEEAQSLCRRALALVEGSIGPTQASLPSVLSTLASVEVHLGEYGKAEQNIRRAIAIRKQYRDDLDTELVAYYTKFGVVLCAEGKCAQADQVVRQALSQCELSNIVCQTGIRATLGAISVKRKRYAEGEEWYKGSLELLFAAYGSSNSMLFPVLSELASLYANRRRYTEAEAAGRRALEIAAKELSHSDAAAKAAMVVGQAVEAQGRIEEAEPYFKESLRIHEQAQGPESIEYALAMQQYARFLRRAKRSSEAKDIEARATEVINRADQKVNVSELATHR